MTGIVVLLATVLAVLAVVAVIYAGRRSRRPPGGVDPERGGRSPRTR